MFRVLLTTALWIVPVLAITKGTTWSQGCPNGISPIVDDPTAYMQVIYNRPQKRHCAPGTRFDPTSCMCSIMNEALPIGIGSSFREKHYSTTVATTTSNAQSTSPKERDFIGSVFGLSRLSPMFPLPDQNPNFKKQQKDFFKTQITSIIDRQEILKSNKQIAKQLQDGSGVLFIDQLQDKPISVTESVFDYTYRDVTTTSAPVSLDSIISNSNTFRKGDSKQQQQQNKHKWINKIERQMTVPLRTSIDEVVTEQNNNLQLNRSARVNEANLKNDITNLINSTSTQIPRTIFQIGQWGLGLAKIPQINSNLIASSTIDRQNQEEISMRKKANRNNFNITTISQQINVNSNGKTEEKPNTNNDTQKQNKNRQNDGSKISSRMESVLTNVERQQEANPSLNKAIGKDAENIKNKQLLNSTLKNPNENYTNSIRNEDSINLKNNQEQNRVNNGKHTKQKEQKRNNGFSNQARSGHKNNVMLTEKKAIRTVLVNKHKIDNIHIGKQTEQTLDKQSKEKTALGLRTSASPKTDSIKRITRRNKAESIVNTVNKAGANKLSKMIKDSNLQNLPKHIVNLLKNVVQISSQLNSTRLNKLIDSSLKMARKQTSKTNNSKSTSLIPTTASPSRITTPPSRTTPFPKSTTAPIPKNKISIAAVNKAKHSGVLKSLPFNTRGLSMNNTKRKQNKQNLQMSETNGNSQKQSNVESNLHVINNVKPVGAGFQDGVFNIYTTTSTELPKKTIGFQIRPWLPTRLLPTNANNLNQDRTSAYRGFNNPQPPTMTPDSVGNAMQNRHQWFTGRQNSLPMSLSFPGFTNNLQKKTAYYPTMQNTNMFNSVPNARGQPFPTKTSPTVQLDTAMKLKMNKISKNSKSLVENAPLPKNSLNRKFNIQMNKETPAALPRRHGGPNSSIINNGLSPAKNINKQFLSYYQNREIDQRAQVPKLNQNILPMTKTNLYTGGTQVKFMEHFIKPERKLNSDPSKMSNQQSPKFPTPSSMWSKTAVNQHDSNKLALLMTKRRSDSINKNANVLNPTPTTAKPLIKQQNKKGLVSLMANMKSKEIAKSKPMFPNPTHNGQESAINQQSMKQLALLMESMGSGIGQDTSSKSGISSFIKPTTSEANHANIQQNMNQLLSLMPTMKPGGMSQGVALPQFLNQQNMQQFTSFMPGLMSDGAGQTKSLKVSKNSQPAFDTQLFKNMMGVNALQTLFGNPSSQSKLNSQFFSAKFSSPFVSNTAGETPELSDVIERSMEGQAEASERATSSSNPTTHNPLLFNMEQRAQNELKKFLGGNPLPSETTLLKSRFKDMFKNNVNPNKMSNKPMESFLQNGEFTKLNTNWGMHDNLFKSAGVQGQNELVSQLFGSVPLKNSNTESNWMSVLFPKSKPNPKTVVNSVSSGQTLPKTKIPKTNTKLQSIQGNHDKGKQTMLSTTDVKSGGSRQNNNFSRMFQNQRDVLQNNFQNFKTFQNLFNGR